MDISSVTGFRTVTKNVTKNNLVFRLEYKNLLITGGRRECWRSSDNEFMATQGQHPKLLRNQETIS